MSVIRVNTLIVRIIPPKNSGNIMQSEYLPDSAIELKIKNLRHTKAGAEYRPCFISDPVSRIAVKL